MTSRTTAPGHYPDAEGIRTFEPFTVHFLAPMTVRIADLNSHVFVRGDEFTIKPLI
jgi:hypothetical protein